MKDKNKDYVQVNKIGEIFHKTHELRFVKKPNTVLPVLQQMWQGDKGSAIWEDVELLNLESDANAQE